MFLTMFCVKLFLFRIVAVLSHACTHKSNSKDTLQVRTNESRDRLIGDGATVNSAEFHKFFRFRRTAMANFIHILSAVRRTVYLENESTSMRSIMRDHERLMNRSKNRSVQYQVSTNEVK